MRVCILGAGSIAFGMAAALAEGGHRPVLWSPSGRSTADLAKGEPLRRHGRGRGLRPGRRRLDLRGGGRRRRRGGRGAARLRAQGGLRGGRAAPHRRPARHRLLARLLRRALPVEAPGGAGRRPADRRLGNDGGHGAQAERDACSRRHDPPEDRSRHGAGGRGSRRATRSAPRCSATASCAATGFSPSQLSNLNPQNHLGIALCNVTRMERGEDWGQGENVTPAVGRFIEAWTRSGWPSRRRSGSRSAPSASTSRFPFTSRSGRWRR